MSRIKQSLPEGFSVLQGDELDGEPDNRAELEEMATGFVMRDLSNAIATIEKNPEQFRSEYDEIDTLTARLQQITAVLDKPF